MLATSKKTSLPCLYCLDTISSCISVISRFELVQKTLYSSMFPAFLLINIKTTPLFPGPQRAKRAFQFTKQPKKSIPIPLIYILNNTILHKGLIKR
jgi:hypothetical protein